MSPSARAVWTTPALLRLGMAAVWVASALLMTAALAGALWDRSSLRFVGRDLSTSGRAVAHLQRALRSLDTAASVETLNPKPTVEHWDQTRQTAVDTLLTAAANITDRDSETEPLHHLGLALGAYSAQWQKGRDLRRAGDPRFAEEQKRAMNIMQEQLLPVADALMRKMAQVLQSAYERQQRTAEVLLLLMICSALLLGVVLIALQLFLARRMRRLVNPLIFCATAAALLFSIYTVNTLERENREIHQLQQESGPTFERDVSRGFQEVAGFEFSAPIAAVFIAALTTFGVLPRLREYRS